MIDKIQFFIFIILLFHLVLLTENFEDVYSKRFENRKQRIHQKPTYYDKLEIPDVEKEKAAAIKYIRECHEGIIFPKVEKPMFTVIIPYRNIGSKIRPALISLERQDLRDFEIILVDDGSIKDPIEPEINDILRRDKRIIIIKNEHKIGFMRSRYLGLINAKGQYIIHMNQLDMIVFDDSFDILYDTSEDNKIDILEFQFFFGNRNKLEEISSVTFEENFPENNILSMKEKDNLDDFNIFGTNGRNYNIFGKVYERKFHLEAFDSLLNKNPELNMTIFDEIDDYLIHNYMTLKAKTYLIIDTFCFYKHLDEDESGMSDEETVQHQREAFSLIKYLLDDNLLVPAMNTLNVLINSDNTLKSIKNEQTKKLAEKIINKLLNESNIDEQYKLTFTEYLKTLN